MGLRALYILDEKGKTLIFRHFVEIGDSNLIDQFYIELTDQIDEGRQNPIITIGDINLAYIKHQNIYIVAACTETTNIVGVFLFLYRARDLFKDYFKELEEESVKDNFVVIYELIDEIIDFGIPQITEPAILKQYITQESYKLEIDKPPSAVTNAVSWRGEGIKYRKNQIYLDVVEHVNCQMSKNGNILNCDINGVVTVECELSGMPEVRMGFNDKLQLGQSQVKNRSKTSSVELEDVKFHQCVRLAPLQELRVISFIPPDGNFELMTYRIPFTGTPPFRVTHSYETFSATRMKCRINIKSLFSKDKVASPVVVKIPVPIDVDSPKIDMTFGTAYYEPVDSCIIWSMNSYRGGRSSQLVAEMSLLSVSQNIYVKAPIQLEFSISYYSVSRIQVKYLKVTEKSAYETSPWVRYLTYNGDYQIRQH